MTPQRATATRWPWVTLLLSAAAVGAHLAPAAEAWLQYDRGALAAGQLWRLVTGHLVHWSTEHLAWDVLVLAAAGAALEAAFGRRPLLLTVTLSALSISTALWLLEPELALYRGLSGVDCALVVAVAVCHLRAALRRGHLGLTAAFATVLALWGAKVGYEALTGRTLFAAAGGAFVPVFLVHLVGGVCGLVTLWASRPRRRPAGRGPGTVGGVDVSPPPGVSPDDLDHRVAGPAVEHRAPARARVGSRVVAAADRQLPGP